MQTLLDAPKIEQILAALAVNILTDPLFESAAHDGHPVALVGIRSRGEILAQRLANLIAARSAPKNAPAQTPIDVGALDITLYRDDVARANKRPGITIPRGTDMNFRLDDRPIVLVDDVISTGRSVRAALDALVDFGRPKLIRLAVLIDRGPREFPIQPDYVGLQVKDVAPSQQVAVHLKPTDPEDGVYLL